MEGVLFYQAMDQIARNALALAFAVRVGLLGGGGVPGLDEALGAVVPDDVTSIRHGYDDVLVRLGG